MKGVMVQKQHGYTLVEAIIGLGLVVAVAGLAGGIYMLCHFIQKFW